jgi:hypothetical protein
MTIFSPKISESSPTSHGAVTKIKDEETLVSRAENQHYTQFSTQTIIIIINNNNHEVSRRVSRHRG